MKSLLNVGCQAGGSLTESFELGVKPVEHQWEQKEKGPSRSATVVTVCIITVASIHGSVESDLDWTYFFYTVRPSVLLNHILCTLSCTNCRFCFFSQCFYLFLSIKETGSGIHRDLKTSEKLSVGSLIKTWVEIWVLQMLWLVFFTKWHNLTKQPIQRLLTKIISKFSCFFPIQNYVETLNRPNKWADWGEKGLSIYLLANPVTLA